jgi:hypothetical protein
MLCRRYAAQVGIMQFTVCIGQYTFMVKADSGREKRDMLAAEKRVDR